jgi:cellulose synthase/poly-beta-1,6-N-acetylglucosamine synthase-like glycosyltransferase
MNDLLAALLLANALFMGVVASTTFVFQSYKWWRPEYSDPDRYGTPDRPVGRGIILLAARFEDQVIGQTLERLAHLHYPSYLVAVIVDHPDDPATLAVARAMAARYPQRICVVRYPEATNVHNKPIGLNAALYQLEAAGIWDWHWVGVLDAEDMLHPDLLTMVDYRFRQTGAGIVQAGVQLMNFSSWHRNLPLPENRLAARWAARSSRRGHRRRSGARVPAPIWYAGHCPRLLRRWLAANTSAWWRAANCLEYFKWFQSRLKVQAMLRVIPLGGNTVFFRREFVDEVRRMDAEEHGVLHGRFWDESCLTEDCKIGITASVLGYLVDVIYIPHMVTREETPQTLWKFVQQRVRWDQGFIQVFVEGGWRELPTFGQRAMAVYILGFQFFQAYTGVVAPVFFLAGLFFKVPVVIVLLAFVPFGLGVLNVGVDVLLLRQFGQTYAERVRLRDYAGLVVGSVFFQLVLALAAVLALVRHLRGVTTWVKTSHVGAHLSPAGPGKAKVVR